MPVDHNEHLLDIFNSSYLDRANPSFCLDEPYSSFLLLPDMLPECRTLRCRCGSIGDGDDMRRLLNIQGDTLQCSLCEEFSHLACQRQRNDVEDDFLCDGCNLSNYFKYNTPQARQQYVQQCQSPTKSGMNSDCM